MVFFTCNHCGESVKKPAVEKHYSTRCRGAVKSVSCMDCLKDFHGDEYVAHTKCITEAEKYSGKDYVHKEPKNSGAKKQESWMDTIRSILDSSEYKLSAQARNAFQRLQSVDNVPRKKAKFQNFVANCMRMPKPLSEEVWNVLEQEQTKMKQTKQQENDAAVASKDKHDKKDVAAEAQQNGVKRAVAEQNGAEEPPKKKSKKKKSSENEQENVAIVNSEAAEPAAKISKKKSKAAANVDAGAVQLNGKQQECDQEQQQNGVQDTANGDDVPTKKKSKQKKAKQQESVVDAPAAAADIIAEPTSAVAEEEFQWSALLEKTVAKHAADGISLEKLKKRLLKKYLAKLGVAALTEKQQKKFDKKFGKNLKKCATVQVDGEIAKPC